MPVKIRAARLLRGAMKRSPVVKRVAMSYFRRPRIERGPGFTQYTSGPYTVISSGADPASRRIGIYLRGACDLPAMFAIAPLLRGVSEGTYSILRDPIHISGSHSDIILQARRALPEDAVTEAIQRLRLNRNYFAPRLFEPTFSLPALDKFGEFRKTVVVLSVAPDFSRFLYRHRQHGYLVDPGGLWLNHSIDRVLTDLETVKWFKQSFEGAGRSSVDDFRASFGEIVRLVRQELEAHVIVFNTLTIEASDPTHNYQLSRKSDTYRRRQFSLALAELSEQLDFHVVDVDRILKRGGVREQVDFAHFSARQFAPIAAEAHRILAELELA